MRKPIKPQTFTASEQVINHLAWRIHASGVPYKVIAQKCGVSASTVYNVASRNTRWPRPHTFFALLVYFNIKLKLED